MFLQGISGMHRRWYDGGQGWTLANAHTIWGLTGFEWNKPISWAAWIMGLAQIPFIINFFWSIKHGEKVNDNPWEATTLEWTAPSPPGQEFTYTVKAPGRLTSPEEFENIVLRAEPDGQPLGGGRIRLHG